MPRRPSGSSPMAGCLRSIVTRTACTSWAPASANWCSSSTVPGAGAMRRLPRSTGSAPSSPPSSCRWPRRCRLAVYHCCAIGTSAWPHSAGCTGVRPTIGVQRLGWEARAQVLASELLPEALRERYSSVSGALLERVTAAFAAAGPLQHIRLHGDCHLGNLLWDEHGPVFVDLDDCAIGARVQDLWMMLAGSPAEQQRQWQDLLEGYQQFADF